MYRKFQPFFIIAETPLHPGSGSELGIVDLPIQRERYTNYPKIEGSGLKGCIREVFEGLRKFKDKKSCLIECEQTKKLKKRFPNIDEVWKEKDKEGEREKKDKDGNTLIEFDRAIELVFGPEEGEAHAGSIAFTDARILLFPVKSLKGIFTWITCPMVLARFVKDMKIAGKENEVKEWNLNNVANTVPKQSNILVSGKVVLEEFTFEVGENDETTKIAGKLSDMIFPDHTSYSFWKEKLKKDIVILSDDDFKDFVSTSTEVITRTKIATETGTVEPGALWTEEYLPQDTVLYSIAMTTAVRVKDDDKKGPFKGNNPNKEAQNVMDFFTQGLPEIVHIGGNQTIGKGIVRIKLW